VLRQGIDGVEVSEPEELAREDPGDDGERVQADQDRGVPPPPG